MSITNSRKNITIQEKILIMAHCEQHLFYCDHIKILSIYDTKAQAAKEKIDELDYIKNKNCVSKDTINSEQTTHTMGENICKSCIQ